MAVQTKILMCIRQGEVGGGETHLLNLCINLPQHFECWVLSFSNGPMVEQLIQRGIKVKVIASKKAFDPLLAIKIYKFLKQNPFDIIHAHGSRGASNIFLVAKILNIPLVYTVHGWSFNNHQSLWRKKARVIAEKLIIRNSTKIICVSKSNKESGLREIPYLNAEVVENGVDLKKFDPYNVDRTEIRKKLGFEDDEIWIGFIARLAHQKDPVSLLKAFARSLDRQSNLRLLIIGEGELYQDVIGTINSLRIDKQVRVLPFQQNVNEYLAAIDIFTLVSLWEGLSIGLLEAMAMGKAIIASKVDGTVELIEQNKNGFLVEPKSVDDFSCSILELAINKEIRIKLGLLARETVIRRFSIDESVKKTISLYENLAN